LASRGYAKEQFSWRHYYYYLTDEGIAYLREYLGLTEDIIPSTLKVPKTSEIRQSFADKGPRGGMFFGSLFCALYNPGRQP
jgi:small subunit ribosomal protein S10e